MSFLSDGGFSDCLLVMPVGAARLALYGLLAKLLPLCGHETKLALMECRLFEIALDAFERYACNNMLHSHVTSLVLHALSEDAPPELPLALLNDAHLGARLARLSGPRDGELDALTSVHLDGFSPGPPSSIRPPWMGHVVVIGNGLLAAEERSELVRKALADDGEWRAFVEGPLAAANANERKTLGGQVRAVEGAAAGRAGQALPARPTAELWWVGRAGLAVAEGEVLR
jgi:hypothetical protein